MVIEMDERAAWNAATTVLLIGPGGAGKSSLGIELAPLLGRRLVDLDIEFQRRIGNISSYIRDEGYERYKLANSQLASDVADDSIMPTVLVTSSGFLTPDNPKLALEANQRLVAACYSICLLPSRDLAQAVSVIVERQLTRPFARDRAREEETIRDRYAVYASLGDLIAFSTASPGDIAQAVARHLTAGRGREA